MSDWNKPKSVCVCGHTGDGPGSQHVDTFQGGHGACGVPGCPCEKFTWATYIDEYEVHMANLAEKARRTQLGIPAEPRNDAFDDLLAACERERAFLARLRNGAEASPGEKA